MVIYGIVMMRIGVEALAGSAMRAEVTNRMKPRLRQASCVGDVRSLEDFRSQEINAVQFEVDPPPDSVEDSAEP
jgi:hypothetical protein